MMLPIKNTGGEIMNWETNRLDEVIARTLDALRESGLNPGTVWRQYNQCYEQLRKYCCDRNTCEYDEELIHAFLNEKTKQYEQGVFKRHRWSAYHRAISVLIEYAATGELLSTFSRKRVKLDSTC